MVKIGVLSDTHILNYAKSYDTVALWLDTWLADADWILHAGDVVDPDLLDAFCGKTVHAVRGNMDPPVPGIPEKKIIEVGSFRIGLIHGWGPPEGLEQRVMREFEGQGLDCLVFGHSHQPLCRRQGDLLLFNPGSPTDRRWAPFHSLGMLTVGEDISGEIIRID